MPSFIRAIFKTPSEFSVQFCHNWRGSMVFRAVRFYWNAPDRPAYLQAVAGPQLTLLPLAKLAFYRPTSIVELQFSQYSEGVVVFSTLNGRTLPRSGPLRSFEVEFDEN